MDLLIMTAAALARGVVQRLGRVAVPSAAEAGDAAAERRCFATVRESASELRPGPSADRPSSYSFKEQWKELLVYTETGDPGGTYTFLCGWGNFERPFSVGVPTAETWDRAMPEFMRGRRDEILARLRDWAGGDYVIDEYEPAHLRPEPE